MIYNNLGSTDLKVSKLCFGSLTVSPLQANLPFDEGSSVIKEAFNRGVNFIDTAELYDNYEYIRLALKDFKREDIVISTKSYSFDKKTAKDSLEKALKELDTDYIDLFMLHEQESVHTIRGHYEALEYFMKMKEKGYIRALGLSTHFVEGVKGANQYSEIEVIHPIINKNGLGIVDGNREDMIRELIISKELGKGIFAMKPLGGGNLLSNIDECFDFVLGLDFIDSIAVGMQRLDEVKSNVLRFSGEPIPKELTSRLRRNNRQLHIAYWCSKCGNCVKACKSNALNLTEQGILIDREKCVLCGYCSKYCKDFCIKIV